MAEVSRALGLLVVVVAEMTTVYWEDDPARTRTVERLCDRCDRQPGWLKPDEFNIVSPSGVAHYAAEYNEGRTLCGIDATGLEWWWRT